MRRRKASLSLSINAIVILVLAIVMLGLGIGFTKGMFSKLSARLEVPEPDIPATPEDPIVLPSESIEVLKTKDFQFTVNYYNGYTSGDVQPLLECVRIDLGTPGEDDYKVTVAKQWVDAGTYKPFKFLVDALGIQAKDICTIQFDVIDPADSTKSLGRETKQIIINAK